MKINKLSMALVMAASLLAVSPLAHAQETNAPAAPARPAGRGRGPTVESIDKAVTLTDAEKPKVKAALDEYNTARTDAANADPADRRTKLADARKAFDGKMKEILTPDQYTKFQAMPRPGRGGAGGGAGGGGNPPPAGGN
jgi:Spy/CpxP family protein refolding chaperone